MAKWLTLLIVLVLIPVIGWLSVRQIRVTPEWLRPKTGKVTMGDIRVPILSAGLIEPYQRIEVKSKASGEVTQINVVEGTRVRQGEVLVELRKIDEQRSVDRAQAAVDRADAALADARVKVEQSKINVTLQEARARDVESNLTMAEFDRSKVEERSQRVGDTSEQELLNSRMRVQSLEAQLEAARANVKSAKNSILEAEAAQKIQEANKREAERVLEDAKERLIETTIRAPVDALVTEVKVRIGTLVQSGSGQSFTGGTVLMTIADISALKVVTRVDEADYGAIRDISPIEALPQIEALREAAARDAEMLHRRTGKVKITVDTYRGDAFEGIIERVEPQGRLNAGSAIIQFDVVVRITDDRRYLLPLGAQAQVEFTVQKAENAMRVPSDAVKTSSASRDEKGVWVRTTPPAGSNEEWGRKFVPVRFGISDGEFTEVVEVIGDYKLKVDDEVYTKLPRRNEDGE